MCEYDPDCSKRDHPLAGHLWKAKKRAAALVLCPSDYHPIAAVFDLPNAGRVLCCPSQIGRRGSHFADPQPDGSPLENPNGFYHLHADVRPLSEYEDDDVETGRCRCGTWNFRPSRMDPGVDFGFRNGKPVTLSSFVEMADSPRNREKAEKAAGINRDTE